MTEKLSAIYARLNALEEEMTELRRKLVAKVAGTHRSESEISVLVCRAAEQRLGLLLGSIEVVVPVAQLLPLPETPAWVLGSLNHHGSSIVVLDVAHRLTNTTHTIAPTELIVICSTEWQRVGLLVGEVLDVLDIEVTSVQDPAPGVRFAPFLAGVIHRETGSLPLVEVSKLAAEFLTAKGKA